MEKLTELNTNQVRKKDTIISLLMEGHLKLQQQSLSGI